MQINIHIEKLSTTILEHPKVNDVITNLNETLN